MQKTATGSFFHTNHTSPGHTSSGCTEGEVHPICQVLLGDLGGNFSPEKIRPADHEAWSHSSQVGLMHGSIRKERFSVTKPPIHATYNKVQIHLQALELFEHIMQ